MTKLGEVVKGFLREHFQLVVLVLLFFIVGSIIGGISVTHLHQEQQTALKNYLDQNFQLLVDQPANRIAVVGQTVLGNLKIGISLWFLGLTVIGLPLIGLIILVRGFILGFTTGFLIQQKSLQGAVLIILGIIPQNLIYIPFLLLGGVLSTSFSLYLIRGRISVARTIWTRFFSYSLSMLIIIIGLIIAGLIEGLVAPAFLRLLIPVISS
ncbi:MAG: stage II sporulation protein M [Syntrophomonadaceae bacterium]|nr:stage II sporulation protein M [Syntrophomonadaceae bacterium]